MASSSGNEVCCIVDSIPGYGRGMIATRHINNGDSIMTDPYNFIVEYGEGISDLESLSDAYREIALQIVKRICKSDDGAIIEDLCDKLHFIDHADYANQDANTKQISERLGDVIHKCLYQLRGEDYKSYVTGEKIKKLIYKIKFNSITTSVPTNEQRQHLHLSLSLSAINHSCIPNAIHAYIVETDPIRVSWKITACRPIKKGEQIFITYLNPIDTYCLNKRARIGYLKETWSFKCVCQRCTDENELDQEIISKLNYYRDALNETFRQEYITGDMRPSSTEEEQTHSLTKFPSQR